MRIFVTLFFITIISAFPSLSNASSDKNASAADKAVEVVKENPGASAGVAACGVAIAFFPPAALVCGGAIAAGLGVDKVSK